MIFFEAMGAGWLSPRHMRRCLTNAEWLQMAAFITKRRRALDAGRKARYRPRGR